METVLKLASDPREPYDAVVLGAWGSGSFGHPDERAAQLWLTSIARLSHLISNTLKKVPIVFSMIDWGKHQNFAAYKNVFQESGVNPGGYPGRREGWDFRTPPQSSWGSGLRRDGEGDARMEPATGAARMEPATGDPPATPADRNDPQADSYGEVDE